jgi:hypothetical protein
VALFIAVLFTALNNKIAIIKLKLDRQLYNSKNLKTSVCSHRTQLITDKKVKKYESQELLDNLTETDYLTNNPYKNSVKNKSVPKTKKTRLS